MTRMEPLFCPLAILALGACFRVEALVDVQKFAEPRELIVFDAQVPAMPTSMPLFLMEPAPPSGEVLELFQKRCAATCGAMLKSGGDKDLNTLRLCGPSDAVKGAASGVMQGGMRGSSAVSVNPESEYSPCRIGPDYSFDIYPRLQRSLEGVDPKKLAPLNQRQRAARKFLERASAEEGDIAPVEISSGRALAARTLGDVSDKGDATLIPLLYTSAKRRVAGGYRVDGPGSRFSVVIDPFNGVEGMTRTWRRPIGNDSLTPLRTFEQLKQEIIRQLSELQSRMTIHVMGIELVYYDGDHKLMQPAFRYTAELGHGKPAFGGSERVVGYVPYAATDEALPSLLIGNTRANVASLKVEDAATTFEDVTFATYVVRGDKPAWAANAVAFRDALVNGMFGAHLHFSAARLALPEHFSVASRDYVDTTDFALVEAHGSRGRFATQGSNMGVVGIGMEEAGFPESGYGPNAGGRLRHWALHSCDVLAEPEKTPWPVVFRGGLQTVVGYSTAMYITDGAGESFAHALAAAAPVVASWFATVNSLNVYQLDATASSHCGADEPIGRPSALTACGAEDATLFGRVTTTPDCVRVWTTLQALVE